MTARWLRINAGRSGETGEDAEERGKRGNGRRVACLLHEASRAVFVPTRGRTQYTLLRGRVENEERKYEENK
jgi:hypothetical protein